MQPLVSHHSQVLTHCTFLGIALSVLLMLEGTANYEVNERAD